MSVCPTVRRAEQITAIIVIIATIEEQQKYTEKN